VRGSTDDFFAPLSPTSHATLFPVFPRPTTGPIRTPVCPSFPFVGLVISPAYVRPLSASVPFPKRPPLLGSRLIAFPFSPPVAGLRFYPLLSTSAFPGVTLFYERFVIFFATRSAFFLAFLNENHATWSISSPIVDSPACLPAPQF